MSTRSGDLDPGLTWHLARIEQMTPRQLYQMLNHESGLLGVSELSPDMRDLLSKESTDERVAEAIALFCYHAKKRLCAFAGALEGLDTLVFAGGIGENVPLIRELICTMKPIHLTPEPNFVHGFAFQVECSTNLARRQ